jgi:hypothetical protein
MAHTPRLFQRSKNDENRLLLGLMFSNSQLAGPTLRYSLRKPFDVFANVSSTHEWCALVDVVRTDFRQHVVILYSKFPSELKASLQPVIEGHEKCNDNVITL